MAMKKDGVIIEAGKTRPGEPETWSRTSTKTAKWRWATSPEPAPPNHEVPMTFHHVIGWQRLWQMWNHLIAHERWDVITAWAYLLQISDTDIAAMKGGTLADSDDAYQKVCWAKWNMVEGPRGENRTDDPSKTKDDLDFFKYGGSHAARTRLLELSGLFSATTVALQATTKDDPGIKTLGKLFADLKHLRGKEIVAFDESMWEVVKVGKYNEFGIAERHTTWCKRTRQ
jgi:hypothetical protein